MSIIEEAQDMVQHLEMLYEKSKFSGICQYF